MSRDIRVVQARSITMSDERIREFIKSILPKPVLRLRKRLIERRWLSDYSDLPTADVFQRIYEKGAWGSADQAGQRFYSGSGSHDQAIVDTYVKAVRGYLARMSVKPNVVDLGCGDFHIGKLLRDACGDYIACDVVASLIEFNRERFRALNVDFRALDLTRDELPPGDLVFIRQVLQHLSNDKIAAVVPKLPKRYKHLILTEHVPQSKDFRANRDMPTGPAIRLTRNSGVVLTEPPFNLQPRREEVLCEVAEVGGIIRTIAYEL
jgi:SAM-dependent methyltransferase